MNWIFTGVIGILLIVSSFYGTPTLIGSGRWKIPYQKTMRYLGIAFLAVAIMEFLK